MKKKYSPCPQCHNTYLHCYKGQWRCPKCTAQWRTTQAVLAEDVRIEAERAELARASVNYPTPSLPVEINMTKTADVESARTKGHRVHAPELVNCKRCGHCSSGMLKDNIFCVQGKRHASTSWRKCSAFNPSLF